MEKVNTWKLNVPKICHFYWGGGKLIYLRYLAFKTFAALNPDWQIILWQPQKHFTGRSWGIERGDQPINYKLMEDYTDKLGELPITQMKVDFESLKFWSNMAEVHKNDYIRINSLYLYGGLWSDTDILYFKSMDDLCVNTEENKDKEVYVCIADYGHSTGFNMAIGGSKFFTKLLENLNPDYKPLEYQCWGPDMFNKYFRKLKSISGGVNIPMDVVYAHNCHNVKELLNGNISRFTNESIGCHWYGGNTVWGRFLNETAGGEKNLKNNIISQLIKNAQALDN